MFSCHIYCIELGSLQNIVSLLVKPKKEGENLHQLLMPQGLCISWKMDATYIISSRWLLQDSYLLPSNSCYIIFIVCYSLPFLPRILHTGVQFIIFQKMLGNKKNTSTRFALRIANDFECIVVKFSLLCSLVQLFRSHPSNMSTILWSTFALI